MEKKMLSILLLGMFLILSFASLIQAEDIYEINEPQHEIEDCGCGEYEGISVSNNKRYYTGLLPSKGPTLPREEFTGMEPPSWDWRNYLGKDWTTPIKDQGNCGSCYAFAPYASWESCYKIESNSPDLPIDLSEQYMVSCGSQGWGHGLIHGCAGASLEGAYYFMDEHGAVPESCFPYSSGGGTWPRCENKCPIYLDLKMDIDWWGYVANTQSSLKNAIIEKGPIVVGLYVYDDFFDYSGGIYKHNYGEYASMHLLTVVGYNDNPGYWICKNSWSEDWGEPNPYDPSSEGGWCRIKYYECYFGFAAAFLDVSVDEIIEDTCTGQEYIDKQGDVVDYDASHLPGGSKYAVCMAHYGSDATAYYDFNIGYDEVIEGMNVRVEYSDIGSGKGLDLYAYDWKSFSWKSLNLDMGSHNKLKWIWTTTTNSNNYIRSDGLFKIKLFSESQDDVILDEINIRYRYPKEDLDCVDSGFDWSVSPLGTASNYIRIRNIGDPDTELDWEIVDWPDWGKKWIFNPENGEGLKPDDGLFKILVTAQAPEEPNQNFFGVIRIENANDSSDYEIVKINLATPRSRILDTDPLFQRLLARFPNVFLMLKHLFNLQYSR